MLLVKTVVCGLACVTSLSGAGAWSSSGLSPLVASIEYVGYGSRLDWCRATGEVAFDRAESDGLFDLYVGLGAANQRCLTCTDARFPGHNGNPAWQPSGQNLVFQAQDVTLPFLPIEKAAAQQKLTSPGWGTNNHLWTMSRDGKSAWLVRQIAAGQATLHPHFSNDGRKLVWTEKIALVGIQEQWAIKIGDLLWENGVPRLDNITEIAPFGLGSFYETHGFSADDSRIIFTSGDVATRSLDIYTYELAAGTVRNLTNSPGVWDEHAHMSPDGTKIVWASARDITIPRVYIVPYLDYWIMDADGANPQRLTYFNEPTDSDFVQSGVVTTDLSFSADGKTLLGRLELPRPDLGQRAEVIARIRLK